MKKIMFVCVLSFIASFSYAQKLDEAAVPKVVKESLAKRFPKAKDVKWSKENGAEFEAEFEIGEVEQSVNFTDAGVWLVTETEIKKSQLPAAVQATIAKEFAGFKMEEAEKADTADKGTFYEVELEKGKLNYEVQIAADGKVINKEDKKEKDKEKE